MSSVGLTGIARHLETIDTAEWMGRWPVCEDIQDSMVDMLRQAADAMGPNWWLIMEIDDGLELMVGAS